MDSNHRPQGPLQNDSLLQVPLSPHDVITCALINCATPPYWSGCQDSNLDTRLNRQIVLFAVRGVFIPLEITLLLPLSYIPIIGTQDRIRTGSLEILSLLCLPFHHMGTLFKLLMFFSTSHRTYIIAPHFSVVKPFSVFSQNFFSGAVHHLSYPLSADPKLFGYL